MKAMLDTHCFLWAIANDPRLSRTARRIIKDPNSDLYLSAASAWEIAIKTRLGRLRFSEDVQRFIPAQMARNRITELPVLIRHSLAVADLPLHHRDPFDRLLVAQARIEDLTLLSADPAMRLYDVRVVW